MLIKRKKRMKVEPQCPKRQILCYWCSAPVLTDDRPGDPHPPYRCPSCRRNWPPTLQEEAADRREKETALAEGERRVQLARQKLAEKRALGEPLFTVPGTKQDRKRRAEKLKTATKIAVEEEQRLNEILLGRVDRRGRRITTARGRKPDPAYDRAFFKREVATVTGKKLPMSDLVKAALPNDKSEPELKLDKLKQAMKRRMRMS